MPSDHDVIIDGFPNPTIAPIIGLPNYATIADIHLKLNANAASVFSSLGDGAQGLLSLTVSDAIYNSISDVPFVTPINPGPQPVIPGAATGNQITAITRAHNENHRIWKEYLATDKALKQQLLAAVHESYYRTLRHRITGFANTTTRQLLDHLYATYGNLTPADLVENDERMKAPYDPSQPIEVLFDQIDDAVELADAANAAYTPAQIVAIAYNCLFQTGLYTDACREWRRRDPGYRTWPHLKRDFALAHQELRESQVSAQNAGYHGANLAYDMQQETATALANLATATAQDRSTVSQLTSTNSQLSAQLQTITAKLNQALTELSSLKSAPRPPTATTAPTTLTAQLNAALAENARLQHNHQTPVITTPPAPTQRTPIVRRWFNTNYCWTHGYHVDDEHTSITCKHPKPGHNQAATRANTLQGKPWNKTLVGA
jgi:hypothetical protein